MEELPQIKKNTESRWTKDINTQFTEKKSKSFFKQYRKMDNHRIYELR